MGWALAGAWVMLATAIYLYSYVAAFLQPNRDAFRVILNRLIPL
jgi:hypothetical protein